MPHPIPPSNAHLGSSAGSPKPQHILLTDKGIKALKPTGKRRTVWMQGLPGLGLRITPKGTKSFIYKYGFNGRDRWITLGQYPKIKIRDILTLYADTHEKVQSGEDPACPNDKDNQTLEQVPTVRKFSEEYIENYAKAGKKSWQRDESILINHVIPAWGNRELNKVTRRDVIALLDSIVAKGHLVQANRTLAIVRRMFNYAIDRDVLENSPCFRVKPPSSEIPKDRYLSLDEISIFWQKLETAPLQEKTKLALKLMLLTLQRSSEVLGIKTSELDLQNATWLIPKERTKNKKPHFVPLSPAAIGIIEKLISQAGPEGYLFASDKGVGHFHSTSISHAVSRNLEYFGLNKFTPHDLRRTGSTLLAAFRVSRFDRDRILNHTDRSIGATYDVYNYMDEKSAGLNLWADIVLQCAHIKTPINLKEMQKSFKHQDYIEN